MDKKIDLKEIKGLPLNYYYMKVNYNPQISTDKSDKLKDELFFKNISRIG